jgi:LytS/YehU family sensor histidine kinase
MLARLSELLRATLEHGSDKRVPLEIELELLGTYLDIEQVRFGERLEVMVTADAAARATLVPPLILQPLVENAVKHGVARHSGASRVDVVAEVTGDELVLRVSNTGPDSPSTRGDAPANGGIGLANTRQRLTEMYGSRATLTLDVLPTGGARATIRIPRSSEPADAVLATQQSAGNTHADAG